jgi:Major tropism determinant N-terminal domain
MSPWQIWDWRRVDGSRRERASIKPRREIITRQPHEIAQSWRFQRFQLIQAPSVETDSSAKDFPMSIQVKRRREAASFLSTFTGAPAELVVDTTNNRVQVHDGVTAGGWPAAKLAEVVTNARTAVADANYAALTSDRSIAFTAITAARTVTLPAASAFPTGVALLVFDESGACSATNTITLAAAGADKIDGAASAFISSAYGHLATQSNGANKWTLVEQAASNLAAVGIGTPADPNNPLSVYAASALFNSANSFNVTVNKAAAADTASFIFEDGFSGRAQIGLCGDDNFHFKVSANGSTWIDALDINGVTGKVTIAAAPPAGDCSAAAITSAWHGQNLPGGGLNKFRNASMDVWQRGAAAMSVSTTGAYTADGWIVVPTGASCGAQAGAGRALSVNSLQVYGGAGVTDVVVKQRIESYVAAPLSGQPVTVQAQVYNNTGGAIAPTLTVKHAGAADNWSTSTTDVSAVALQSCAAGAWTKIAYTFNASASSAAGLEIAFDFGNNFAAGANSIELTEFDIRATPGVATGQNANPPPPELRPLPQELLFCQRYYFRLVLAANYTFIDEYASQAAANCLFQAVLPVTMRATPSFLIGGTYSVGNAGTPSLNGSNMLMAYSVPASAAGRVYVNTQSSGGYFSASAEL